MYKSHTQFDLSKKTIIISFFTQFFQYGISLLVLPIILRKLNTEDIGVWYIFLSILSLVGLMDLGFAPSIQRSVAYVASGSQELHKDGFIESKENEVNERLMTSLLQTSKKIYKKISFAILILSLTIGTVYLSFNIKDFMSLRMISTWIFFVISITINFYYSYILSFIKGLGLIKEFNLNIIYSKSAYVIVLYIMVLLGWGLMSLVAATFISIMIMTMLGKKVLRKKVEHYSDYDKAVDYDDLFNILWKNAKNSGIVGVGVFLLSQAGVLLSGSFLEIEKVAQLGLILQLFGIIVVLSRVYFNISIPKISALWIRKDKDSIKRLFFKTQMFGYLIFFLGLFSIIFGGNYVLKNIIHSSLMLPSNFVILLYGFFYLMEITHGNCCSLISTSNYIPFTKASVLSGITSIILTVVFINFNLGMVSFPLALCASSLPYNAWKWPIEVLRMLRK